MKKYIYRHSTTSITEILKIKKRYRGCPLLETHESSLIDGKYPGSHRKLRPAGAEYEKNDEQLRNLAAHSGLP